MTPVGSFISLFLVFCTGVSNGQRFSTPPSLSLNAGSPRLIAGQPVCVDNHRRCRSWARDGGCVINWGFMATQCRKICGFCDIQGQTAMYNHEKKLRTRIMTDYNVSTRPMKNTSDSIDVALAFSLVHLLNVDEPKQTVTVQGYLKMKWSDSRLRWAPSDHGEINRLAIQASDIWHPSIIVVNTGVADNAFLLRGNPTPVMVNNEGVLVWTPRVEAVALCDFDVKTYPVDGHFCTLTFGPWMQDGNMVNMTIWKIDDEPDEVDPYLLPNRKWRVSSSVRADDDFISPCCSEPWPVVHVDLKIQRLAPLITAAIITPVIYVVITLLFCFLLPIRSVIRFFFATSDCIILILLLLYLSQTMPDASSTTPIVAQIIISLILESLLIMLYCGMLYHLSSPRCKTDLVKLMPDAVKKISFGNFGILQPGHKETTDDNHYTRAQEPQDLVDMFFGSDDQTTLLPKNSHHITPHSISDGTVDTAVSQANGDSPPETPLLTHRHVVILLNRFGLCLFTLILAIQLLVLLCF